MSVGGVRRSKRCVDRGTGTSSLPILLYLTNATYTNCSHRLGSAQFTRCPKLCVVLNEELVGTYKYTKKHTQNMRTHAHKCACTYIDRCANPHVPARVRTHTRMHAQTRHVHYLRACLAWPPGDATKALKGAQSKAESPAILKLEVEHHHYNPLSFPLPAPLTPQPPPPPLPPPPRPPPPECRWPTPPGCARDPVLPGIKHTNI